MKLERDMNERKPEIPIDGGITEKSPAELGYEEWKKKHDARLGTNYQVAYLKGQ